MKNFIYILIIVSLSCFGDIDKQKPSSSMHIQDELSCLEVSNLQTFQLDTSYIVSIEVLKMIRLHKKQYAFFNKEAEFFFDCAGLKIEKNYYHNSKGDKICLIKRSYIDLNIDSVKNNKNTLFKFNSVLDSTVFMNEFTPLAISINDSNYVCLYCHEGDDLILTSLLSYEDYYVFNFFHRGATGSFANTVTIFPIKRQSSDLFLMHRPVDMNIHDVEWFKRK